MSEDAMFRRTFEQRTRNRRVTIIRQSIAEDPGRMKSNPKTIWTKVATLPGFFSVSNGTEASGEGGEHQGYNAVALFDYDVLKPFETFIDQSCRIVDGSVDPSSDLELVEAYKSSWQIKFIDPTSKSEKFWLVQFDLERPSKGNQVHLK